MTTTATTTATMLSGFPLRSRMFGALMRREFLEHKMAFFTVPIVISVVMLAIAAIALVTIELRYGEIMMNFDNSELFMEDGSISVDGREVRDEAARAVGVIPAMPVIPILPFIIVLPMLGALYEERRDRSYLFWKSMPVSDTEEVLAKLAYIGFAGPLVVFAILAVLGLATTILLTPFMWLHDLPAWDLLWSHFAFVTVWVGIAANYLVWALWAFPLFAWILLASAYAPKAPPMYAILPPVVIGVIEMIVFKSSRFFEAIGQQLGGKFAGFIGVRISDRGRFDGPGGDNLTLGDAAATFAETMMSGTFWMGTVVGIVFIAGAIWTRRYNV